jgi:hypothetical protein
MSDVFLDPDAGSDMPNLRSFKSLDEIMALDRPALVACWQELFGRSPPAYLSISFMRKALAHEWQCDVHSGLSGRLKRQLLAIAKGEDVAQNSGSLIGEGTELIREWNGRTYRVLITADGYQFDGRHHSSLTAIARRITGTNWSGPRFFGLKSARAPRSNTGSDGLASDTAGTGISP